MAAMQIIIDNLLTNYKIYNDNNHNGTLLILHGWGQSSLMWEKVAMRMQEKYKVVVLDFPGFGNSEKPSDDSDIYFYAKFIENFTKKLGIRKCIVMGHSFGGRVGIILAAQSELVEKLILVDAAGIEEKELTVKLKISLAKLLKKLLPGPLRRRVIRLFGSSDYTSAGDMREIFKKIIAQDLTKHLEEIKIPAIIIWGENDEVLPISHAKHFRDNMSNSTLRVVWGADHSPFISKYDEFIKVLLEEI